MNFCSSFGGGFRVSEINFKPKKNWKWGNGGGTISLKQHSFEYPDSLPTWAGAKFHEMFREEEQG